MIITINGKEQELKFTFNSFKHMEDFELGDIAELERKPFKILTITEQLLMGALNCDPKVKFGADDIATYLEGVMEEGSITDVLEELMELLEKSSFFKNLQKPTKKIAKKK